MAGNSAADGTYRFPFSFHAKELAHYFEIIVAHMWDTYRQRHEGLRPTFGTLAGKGLIPNPSQ